jgi:hypothetical protein
MARFDRNKIYVYDGKMYGHFVSGPQEESVPDPRGARDFATKFIGNYQFEFQDPINIDKMEKIHSEFQETTQEEYDKFKKERELIDTEIQYNTVYNSSILLSKLFKEEDLVGKKVILSDINNNELIRGTVEDCYINRNKLVWIQVKKFPSKGLINKTSDSQIYVLSNPMASEFGNRTYFNNLTFISQDGGKLKSKRKLSRKFKKTKRMRKHK